MVIFVIAEACSFKTLTNGEILIVVDVAPVLVLPPLHIGRVVLRVFALAFAAGVIVLDHYRHAILIHAHSIRVSAVSGRALLPSRRYMLRRFSGRTGAGGRGRSSSSSSSRFLLSLRPGGGLCVALEGMLPR